jgi:hypothetical protein
LTPTDYEPPVLRGAIERLLNGPTRAERRRGYGGWFSTRTAGALRSVSLSRGVAAIDLRDLRRVYSFNGSRTAFYEWLQRSPP